MGIFFPHLSHREFTPEALRETRCLIAPFLKTTPLVEATALARRVGRPVFLKLESLQETGSFKLRGAAAFLLTLTPEERMRGVVTCSSGNHGRAVAHMAGLLGIPAVICVPRWVDPVKLEGMRRAGVEVRRTGNSYDQAEEEAEELAASSGATLVPPFDHPRIIAGQGSLGLEIMEELPEVAELLVPLSGGGLVAGVGVALRGAESRPCLAAVSAERARVMVESLRAGRPVSLPEEPTLAGALAGGIGGENRWTLPLVASLVDQHILVTEDEIANAILFLHNEMDLVVEGGGAVAVAALLAGAGRREGKGPVVAVVSGGNLDPAVLAALRRDG